MFFFTVLSRELDCHISRKFDSTPIKGRHGLTEYQVKVGHFVFDQVADSIMSEPLNLIDCFDLLYYFYIPALYFQMMILDWFDWFEWVD